MDAEAGSFLYIRMVFQKIRLKLGHTFDEKSGTIVFGFFESEIDDSVVPRIKKVHRDNRFALTGLGNGIIIRHPEVISKPNNIAHRQLQLQLLLLLLLLTPPIPFTTVLHLFPVFLPLFAPSERSTASSADFHGQTGLLMDPVYFC